jgi:dipeptidyl aminopeptidase/acylaminoacyl peptidase
MRLRRCLLLAWFVDCCLCSSVFAQDIAGVWEGSFVFGQGKLRTILYVAPRHDGAYTGALITLESGDAADAGPITVADGKVVFEVKSTGWIFDGTLLPSGNEIKGKFTAGGSNDVTFTREPSFATDIADQYRKQEYWIPMRDGVDLHTIVFSPSSHIEPLPFLIERSPYGWDQAALAMNLGMADLARDGYFFVFQDVRGRHKSEGQFVMQRPVRTSKKEIDEGTDTYDTIEWLLKHIPGNNGRAGILGISYGGWLAEMALIEPHPALKAASEQSMANLRGE